MSREVTESEMKGKISKSISSHICVENQIREQNKILRPVLRNIHFSWRAFMLLTSEEACSVISAYLSLVTRFMRSSSLYSSVVAVIQRLETG